MRGYYKRRSPLKLALWCGVFASLSLFLAWRLDWLPGGGRDESPLEQDELVVLDAKTSQTDGEKNAVPEPVDPNIFSRQSEPGSRGSANLRLPDRFPAAASKSMRIESPRRKPRDGSRGGTSKKGLAAFSPHMGLNPNSDRSPPRVPVRRNSGIRLAGHQRPLVKDDASPPAATLGKIDRLLQAGDYKAAHKQLSQIYWKHPEWRDAIRQRIERVANSIYFDSSRHYMRPYVVQLGDQLRNIAKKYNVTWQYLERLNGVSARKIRPGMKLKVIRGPFSAVVNLKNRDLTIHHHGYFVARYDVGIGKEGKTPIGKHSVDDKLVNPTYYGPEGVIKADDPSNPLGERWISIGNSFGIHGTNDPKTIGKAESRGCIRMRNADVEWVYDFLSVGSEVIIQP